MTESHRSAYRRGWSASARGSEGALERADHRGEVDAWYDGYLDHAAGRERYHLETCQDRDRHLDCRTTASTWHIVTVTATGTTDAGYKPQPSEVAARALLRDIRRMCPQGNFAIEQIEVQT